MKLSDIDKAVLDVLATKRDRSVTAVIRSYLDNPGTPTAHIKTSTVLKACRRLAAKGLIAEAPTSYVVQKCWAITEAGLRAIA